MADLNPERTTWWPRDLRRVLAGEQKPPPDLLMRSDGRGVFYRGRVNSVFGVSGDGKTKLVLAAAVEEIRAGRSVLFVDFEDDEAGVAEALLEHVGHLFTPRGSQVLGRSGCGSPSRPRGHLRVVGGRCSGKRPRS